LQGFLVSLVVPVYNEEQAVARFLSDVREVFHTAGVGFEVVFVNDGSSDDTLGRLLSEQKRGGRIRIVDLSRNFGKEAALTAGLCCTRGDVVVPIDVDLQDPPQVILQMIAKWREGYEVVLGRRVDRSSDSWLKRQTAFWFYRIHNGLSDIKLPENVGDFRLMDRKVIDALQQLPESHRFMKGLFAWLGFRTAYVDYSRAERVAGKTKFSGWKLWNLALEGITGFSTVPLRIWTYFGLLVAACSVVFALFIAVRVLVQGVDVPGYASLMVAIAFLGGLQLTGIGILGEYLGRTYLETKRRPVYVIRHQYEADD
jgi:glycosyltransferase involved in cell wall biosynthesis